MKFVISCSALYSRLAAASKVLAAKNSINILECFLLDIKNGHATITASDGEKYFITSVPLIDSDNNVQFCVIARQLMDSIKELSEQPITIEYNPESRELRGIHQTGMFNLLAQDATAYPTPLTLKEQATSLTMPADVLNKGITRCLFATANDELRAVMMGVYMDIHEGDITFAGTNGRKLVRYINKEVQPGITTGFILPKKVANIVKGVLPKEGDITLNFDTERASITCEDFLLYFRMIEGNYPNYNSVIPNNPYSAIVDRASLLGALKRVSVFCSQSTGLMKLHLENGSMKLSGQDNDFATSVEENLMCEYSGNPVNIGFSCQLMIEIATILETESLTIKLADPGRPGVIVPTEQPEEEDTLMLLMPMMLND